MGKELSPTRPPSTSSDANCKPRLYLGFQLKSECESSSVLSDSLWPHGLYSPWNSPGQNTGVGSLSLLQGIFSTQGSNPGLPHCRRILYQLSHKLEARASDWLAINQRMPTPWVQQFVRAAHRTQEPVRSLGYQLVTKVRGDKDDREATSAWGHVSKCF